MLGFSWYSQSPQQLSPGYLGPTQRNDFASVQQPYRAGHMYVYLSLVPSPFHLRGGWRQADERAWVQG